MVPIICLVQSRDWDCGQQSALLLDPGSSRAGPASSIYVSNQVLSW